VASGSCEGNEADKDGKECNFSDGVRISKIRGEDNGPLDKHPIIWGKHGEKSIAPIFSVGVFEEEEEEEDVESGVKS
jgi:hypothetical protein